MKNNYTISPNYLLQLENDELRERIKKLVSDFNELKKLIEEIKKQENEIDNDKIF
jgi:FtsZ-binding cell division protein ZapB